MVLMVTGLRVVDVAPKGECELQRALTTGINFFEVDIDDGVIMGRHTCEAIRSVFIVARDISADVQRWERLVVQSPELLWC
jgi:hypothetical protein